MKKVFFLCLLSQLFLLFVSCKDKYVMPHTPGVYIDKEGFNTQKEFWLNSGITNYTYTFSFNGYPPYNAVADVTVIGETIDCVLKEYKGRKNSQITEEDKISFEQNMQVIFENFRIEKVYESIETSIKRSYEAYKKDSDCYYSKFTFEFIDTAPFINHYMKASGIMVDGMMRGSSSITIKIENFVEVLP